MKTGIKPPSSLEVEKAILGAILIDPKAIGEVLSIFKTNPFYLPEHQEIFNAAKKLYTNSKPVDIVTIGEELKRNAGLNKCGGLGYVIELSQSVGSSAHLNFHCHIVLQDFVKRELISVTGNLSKRCYEESEDIFDLIDSSYTELNTVAEAVNIEKEAVFSDVITEVVEKGVQIKKGVIQAGIPTPIKKLNNVYKGWKDSNLIILAGRPGMGKTAFALCSILEAAKNKLPVIIFSLEMSKAQLVSRLLSIETEIPLDRFVTKGLDYPEVKIIEEKRKELDNYPLFLDDNTNSITELVIKAKRLYAEHKIKMLVIDYLQLLTARGLKNREQEIAFISRTLKKLANEINIPILALSQLSRSVETRGGSKRPLLSDLRDSGAIEQDADDVMFLYRPEYYGIDEWDDEERSSTQGQAEIMVSKHRSGSLGQCRMQFIGSLTKFMDLPTSNEIEVSTMTELPKMDFDNLGVVF